MGIEQPNRRPEEQQQKAPQIEARRTIEATKPADSSASQGENRRTAEAVRNATERKEAPLNRTTHATRAVIEMVGALQQPQLPPRELNTPVIERQAPQPSEQQKMMQETFERARKASESAVDAAKEKEEMRRKIGGK